MSENCLCQECHDTKQIFISTDDSGYGYLFPCPYCSDKKGFKNKFMRWLLKND